MRELDIINIMKVVDGEGNIMLDELAKRWQSTHCDEKCQYECIPALEAELADVSEARLREMARAEKADAELAEWKKVFPNEDYIRSLEARVEKAEAELAVARKFLAQGPHSSTYLALGDALARAENAESTISRLNKRTLEQVISEEWARRGMKVIETFDPKKKLWMIELLKENVHAK